MAQCVSPDGGGFLVIDATPIESCTGYVIATPQEFADMQSAVLQPLSVSEGATIGVAIFVAWSIAFGFRQLRRIIEDADLNEGGS